MLTHYIHCTERFSFDNNYISGNLPKTICDLNPTFLQADCIEVICPCCTHCCSLAMGCLEYDEFWGFGDGGDDYFSYGMDDMNDQFYN